MKTNPIRFDHRLSLAFLPSAALALILSTVSPVQAASWEGTDDFSPGITGGNWRDYQQYVGQMLVVGANGHASFTVPVSATTEQNAFIVWRGTPTVAEDWTVDITGHNSAFYPSCQLQLAVVNTEAWSSGAVEGFVVSMMNKLSVGTFGTSWWHYPGGWTPRARIGTTSTDFKLRLVYHSVTQTIEAWYDSTTSGQGWTFLDSMALNDISPGMTATNTFSFAVLGNTDYGPITEGQIWADNFSLSGVVPPVQTIIFDPFTNAANWGPPTKFSPDSDIFVANGVMNYTCTSTTNGGGAISRNTPILPITQDWSMKVDVHLDPFGLTTPEQFSDVFLGFGKTGDWFNTHVMFEYGRGWWGGHNGYYIGDDVRINGTNAPTLFNVWNINITSPTSALRLDYKAANHTITYYWDADAATGGYNWTAQGTANLASGTYNLNLSSADTLTVLLAASSEFQTVGVGQAYFDNLEITIMQPSPPSPFTWITNNGAITITGYTGPGGALTIPSQITGLPVTRIDPWAFSNCKTLTGITIPTTITTIDHSVFAYCSSLTSVTIPNTVTNLGGAAFYSCTSLTNAILGNGVTSLGGGLFSSCTNLASLTFGNAVTNVGEATFQGCSSLASLTFPDTLTSIGYIAFTGCTSLTNVALGDNVATIGNYAFNYCTSLTNVAMGTGVTNIGYGAFEGCESLEAINVAPLNTVYASVDGVLFTQDKTTLVIYPCGRVGSYAIPNGVVTIGDAAFTQCYDLTSVKIPASVTTIGDGAFQWCYQMTGVYFDGNAPNIGSNIFEGVSATVYYLLGTTGWGPTFGGLPTALWNPLLPFTYTTNNGAITITGYIGFDGAITIPESINNLPVTSIGNYAFQNCGNLTSITVPKTVTNIGFGAFYPCENLMTITVDPLNPSYSTLDGVLFNRNYTTLIQCPGAKTGSYAVPTTVTRIEPCAFCYCDNLTSVTIPNTVTSIGGWAFAECARLTTITVDALNPSFSSLDGVLFNRVRSALIQFPAGKTGSYTVPRNVFNIGEAAFIYCEGLTHVDFPQSLSSIGNNAFYGCTRLTDILFPDSVTNIGSTAFSACTSLTSIVLPNGIKEIKFGTFQSCSGLTNVIVPASVTGIGNYPFYYCTGLKGVYCWGNAPTHGSDVFSGANNATVYYLPGTTGWGVTYAGRPTAFWVLPYPVILGNSSYFGVQTNLFGFLISWASNATVVVDASTTITSPIWSPVSTNTLVNGTSYFTDPNWTNYPARFYRVRSP